MADGDEFDLSEQAGKPVEAQTLHYYTWFNIYFNRVMWFGV